MQVIIAGSGVAGLSAAISLRRCGHSVTIYERSSLNHEFGAAINVPPNVARFLVAWGLDVVEAQFVPSESMYIFSPTQRDKVLAYSDFRHNINKYGAHLYYAHRVDLHSNLKRMATAPDGPGTPVTIKTKSEVMAYDPETPSMTLTDGTILTGDLLIGADGIHSISVAAILGHPNPPKPAQHSNCCYRFLIPRALVEDDPETSFFTKGLVGLQGLRIWPDVAGNRRLVYYPCRNTQVLNFTIMCRNDELGSGKEDWNTPATKEEVLKALEGFDPGLLSVVGKCPEFKRWPLQYRPPIPTWHKGNMAIVGDAAHPMLPHLGQGGAQGLEDGLAIGLVMSGATKAEVPERLAVYQKIRHNRASAIQIMSNYGFDQKPPGEVLNYLEGQALPTNAEQTLDFNYRINPVQKVIDHMKSHDPTFQIPSDFFSCLDLASRQPVI
ncbi:FAD binding domain-containing protein [Colletotrichum graminicola]|nr:FAD binding domain-containing protein [Colletotrichum graminicola]